MGEQPQGEREQQGQRKEAGLPRALTIWQELGSQGSLLAGEGTTKGRAAGRATKAKNEEKRPASPFAFPPLTGTSYCPNPVGIPQARKLGKGNIQGSAPPPKTQPCAHTRCRAQWQRGREQI